MNLDTLIESSPAGIARFLLHARKLGYTPHVAENSSEIRDAWTIAYGVGEETYMLVYEVIAGTKRYPTKKTVRDATGLKRKFDMLKVRNQGLLNISSEMRAGYITPFLSEEFDTKLHVTIDLEGILDNNRVKFPAGNGNYFALTLFEVYQTLKSLYGEERVKVDHLFSSQQGK